MLTGRDNVPVDCTRHRLMTHLFTQVKLLKKLQKLAGEVLVALGAPQGDSWAPRAKFFALEPSNWTPAVQPGLCRIWSESKLLVFSRTGSFYNGPEEYIKNAFNKIWNNTPYLSDKYN